MRVLLPLLLIAGCAGSDWEWEDTFDPNKIQNPGTKPPVDTDEPDIPHAKDCNWELGSYQLTSATCGGTAYAEWTNTYDTTTMVVSHNRYRGCDVRVTFQDGTCKEVVQLWVDPDEKPGDPSKVVVEFTDYPTDEQPYGVVECTPFECSWNQDHICKLGDHNGDMMVAVDQSDKTKLAFEHFLTWAAPNCNNTLGLTFDKQ